MTDAKIIDHLMTDFGYTRERATEMVERNRDFIRQSHAGKWNDRETAERVHYREHPPTKREEYVW